MQIKLRVYLLLLVLVWQSMALLNFTQRADGLGHTIAHGQDIDHHHEDSALHMHAHDAAAHHHADSGGNTTRLLLAACQQCRFYFF